MSECYKDPEAYSQLTDNVIFMIMNPADGNPADGKLQKARDILDRIFSRKLYKFVSQTWDNVKTSVRTSMLGYSIHNKAANELTTCNSLNIDLV